ncbi:MAG: hypothetical protein PF440_05355 [Thiomicrorhabdus sp.]|jgi:hypothetical protein|nr:hypothetical protein [Thiomicrorhabdus sp.]
MNRYTNLTHELKVVTFNDGTSQFLMRGQSFESSKPTSKVQAGLTVVELDSKKPKAVKQESIKQESTK